MSLTMGRKRTTAGKGTSPLALPADADLTAHKPTGPSGVNGDRLASSRLSVVDPDDFSEPEGGGIPNFLKRKPIERYRRGA